MAISKRPPKTIHLSGKYELVNDLRASGAVTPGALVTYVNVAGELRFKAHDSADAAAQAMIALEKSEQNLGVDDAYVDGELIAVAVAHPGSTWWMYVPSGANIAPAADLQSNGDGGLKALATGTLLFTALESTGGAVTETTRIRVQRFN